MADYNILTKTDNTKLVSKFLHAQKDVEKAVEKPTIDFVEKVLNKVFSSFGTIHTSYDYNTDGIVSFVKNRDVFDIMLNDENNNVANTEYTLRDFCVLIETKSNESFSTGNRDTQLKNRAIVLGQSIYYLKKIKDNGEILPSCVVIADNDEIFIVPTKVLKTYLDKNYDWNIAPSSVSVKNPELIDELKKDKNIANIYIYHIEKGFNFNEPAKRIVNIVKNNEFEKVRIDEDSLAKRFEDFNKRVFGASTFNTALQMSIFLQALLGSEEIYIHPIKNNVLVYSAGNDLKGNVKSLQLTTTKELPLNLDAFIEFFEQYDRNSYTVNEEKAITAIADTLLDDFDRRFTGDFFTPSIWVDEAHKLIEKALNEYETIEKIDEITGNVILDDGGNIIKEVVIDEFTGEPKLKEGTVDWKDKYVVWDAAAGTKNLTRDYKFRELYSSTLHPEELVVAEGYNRSGSAYNCEGASFQYDFLNDDIHIHELTSKGGLFEDTDKEFKLPEGLLNALKENKPIVFFMNPPYGQASGVGADGKGLAATKIGDMVRGQYGKFSAELYVQFIKRVQMIAETFDYNNDFHFFFFNKGFLTSPNAKNFTKELITDFNFEEGFMLNAGEFNGTSSAWGIIFSHWKLKNKKERSEANRQAEFPFTVKESKLENGNLEIIDIGNWNGKIVDYKNSLPVWFRELKPENKEFNNGEYARTSNGFTPSKAKNPNSSYKEDSFGFLHNNGNNVQFSDKYTGFYSLMIYNGQNGTSVNDRNFERACVNFSVRKAWWQIIKDQNQLWIRDKDVFPAPTQKFQNSKKWGKFVADSVIYSFFASGSNQTSLRNYEYGENEDGTPKKWNIENEFFWKDTDFVKKLATERDSNGKNTKNFNVKIQQDINDFGIGKFGNNRFVYNWLTAHNSDISKKGQKVLDIVDEIFIESFQYRDEYAKLYPKYQLNTFDAGWVQIYKMCFSRDALPAAKDNEKLQELYSEFKVDLRALGDKIAKQYSKDTGF